MSSYAKGWAEYHSYFTTECTYGRVPLSYDEWYTLHAAPPAPANDAAIPPAADMDLLKHRLSPVLRELVERAERAESALTDVGKQLEIADTRNTDLVLALERAEAEAKRLREAVERIGVKASWWTEVAELYGMSPERRELYEIVEIVQSTIGGSWLPSPDDGDE